MNMPVVYGDITPGVTSAQLQKTQLQPSIYQTLNAGEQPSQVKSATQPSELDAKMSQAVKQKLPGLRGSSEGTMSSPRLSSEKSMAGGRAPPRTAAATVDEEIMTLVELQIDGGKAGTSDVIGLSKPRDKASSSTTPRQE